MNTQPARCARRIRHRGISHHPGRHQCRRQRRGRQNGEHEPGIALERRRQHGAAVTRRPESGGGGKARSREEHVDRQRPVRHQPSQHPGRIQAGRMKRQSGVVQNHRQRHPSPQPVDEPEPPRQMRRNGGCGAARRQQDRRLRHQLPPSKGHAAPAPATPFRHLMARFTTTCETAMVTVCAAQNGTYSSDKRNKGAVGSVTCSGCYECRPAACGIYSIPSFLRAMWIWVDVRCEAAASRSRFPIALPFIAASL